MAYFLLRLQLFAFSELSEHQIPHNRNHAQQNQADPLRIQHRNALVFLDDRWIQHHAPGENEPAVEGAVEKLVGEVGEGEEDGRLGDDDVEERT